MARSGIAPLSAFEAVRTGRVAAMPKAAPAESVVRRRLTPEGGRALEILGHAIEYLADEYALDVAQTGVLGCVDPRVEAIQILKALNRAVYYSGIEVQPVMGRVRRWLLGWV